MLASPSILAAFVTPLMFWAGAAATSIPIIIHLLNKRRFRVVVWAAMDFLLAAQRRNARRLKFQRWLLLALRCLALLILAAAIAQFYTEHLAVASLLGGSQNALVIVWDDSYSMGYRAPNRASHFEDSRKFITQWVGELSNADRIAVVSGASGIQPLIDKGTDKVSALPAIAAHNITDAATDLDAGLSRALAALESVQRTTQKKSVVLITDLSRSSLSLGDQPKSNEQIAETLKKKIGDISSQASISIVDVGAADQANTAVTDITTRRPTVVAGVPAELQITVQNATSAPLLDHPLTISVDGVVQSTEKLARIGPGESRTTTVALTIPTPGRHIIEAAIPADLLPLDDVRRLALNVSRELPILLVDGNPGDNHTLGSTTFLQLAFAPATSPTAGSASIFAPRVISELELPRTPLASGGPDHPGYVALILSDTGRFDPTTLSTIKSFVEAGGLLLIFPGPRTNANDMNQMFGGDAAPANRLLPATFGQLTQMEGGAAGAAKEELHFDPMNYAHPVLAPFADAARSGKIPGLSSTQVSHYLRMAVPEDPSIETILKLSDGAPAVLSKRVGKGRVVQFAISADTTWTSFPARPSFVPFMWELLYYGMSRPADGLTLGPGASIRLPADAAPAGTWTGPHGTHIQVVTTVDDQRRGFITGGPLNYAGLYGPGDGSGPGVVAVNPDGREADIRHMKNEEFAQALGLPVGSIIAPKSLDVRQAAIDKNPHGSDLGLDLILAALALFTVETLLARAFSAYR